MDFIGIGIAGAAILAIRAAFYFAIVYLAARLAIRHERRSAPQVES